MPQLISAYPAIDLDTVAQHEHLSHLPECIQIYGPVVFNHECDFALRSRLLDRLIRQPPPSTQTAYQTVPALSLSTLQEAFGEVQLFSQIPMTEILKA